MALIEVKNLTKKYKDLTAVDGISFEVKEGETFAILGPNGAGKTTTLEMMETLRGINKGSVTISGISVKKKPEKIKQMIGVQLQATAYFDFLQIREILQLFADFYQSNVKVKTLLKEVQLENKAKSYAKNLSGGQRQRLSIASALVNNPTALFLDEPTTGLDPQARRNLWGLINKIRSRGKTIILTTHYLEEAEILADRVAIMDKGKIVAHGTPRGLIKEYGGKTHIEFKIAKRINCQEFEAVEGVEKCRPSDHGYLVEVEKVEKVLHRLMEFAEKKGLEFVDLKIKQPSLEDVFLNLTGKKLRE